MRLFVIGFPKSGTTSIDFSFFAAGLKTVHWRETDNKRFIGHTIYQNIFAGRDPFASLEQYECITQADVCLPDKGYNYWPNLDFAVLSLIRETHPECVFLLNTRDPARICASIDKWPQLRERIVRASIPGLPAGYGSHDHEIIRWIENHFTACRRFFANDDKFLEVDIEADDAPERIGRAIGVKLGHWRNMRPPIEAAAEMIARNSKPD